MPKITQIPQYPTGDAARDAAATGKGCTRNGDANTERDSTLLPSNTDASTRAYPSAMLAPNEQKREKA